LQHKVNSRNTLKAFSFHDLKDNGDRKILQKKNLLKLSNDESGPASVKMMEELSCREPGFLNFIKP